MARRNDAGRYLLKGMTPQQIGKHMGISIGSIRQYLCTLVGEGELYRSDIAFNISERSLIEKAIRSGNIPIEAGRYNTLRMASSLHAILRGEGHNIPHDLIQLYLVTRDPRSDLYALICEIEILLHGFVKETLISVYGNNWWQNGIPMQVRKDCQIRREEDSAPINNPYHYTTFIDLKAIIDKKWAEFSAVLPKALITNKQETLQKLQRINDIRNRVMHPVKVMSEYEDDYRFVRKILEELKTLGLSSEEPNSK